MRILTTRGDYIAVLLMGNRSAVQRFAAATLVLFCVLCGWRSARLAIGDIPEDAEYHFRLWSTQADAYRNSVVELDCALVLNPRYTAAWIARGLAAEMAGDRAHSEASLRRSAEIDRTYLPRWTLANFYLRAGDMPQFWTWARRAAEVARDPAALFQLCWRASGDAREILERAIPSQPAVRQAYLDFLISASRLEAAEPLAYELSQAVSDPDLLLRYCDAALARRQTAPARKIWDALAQRRLIPYAANSALTNGDLSSAPLERGFDWRPARLWSATLSFDPAAREMSVTLSGRQPESFDFVEQYIAVEPAATYVFRFLYRTHDLTAANGLSWNLLDARSGADVASVAVAASPDTFRERTLGFSTPPGCGLVRLVLRYRRPAGSVRAEGAVVFSRFSLDRKEKASQKSKVKSQNAKVIRSGEFDPAALLTFDFCLLTFDLLFF